MCSPVARTKSLVIGYVHALKHNPWCNSIDYLRAPPHPVVEDQNRDPIY
jgi:hypothetical protein